jgi:hypothetical protein
LLSWHFEVGTNNSMSSQPEGFKTSLFQTERLAFRSSSRIDLFKKLMRSVTSVTPQSSQRFKNSWKEHFNVSNRYADPVVSTDRRSGKSMHVWAMPFLTATVVPPWHPSSRSVC